jgi:hypothetical protein
MRMTWLLERGFCETSFLQLLLVTQLRGRLSRSTHPLKTRCITTYSLNQFPERLLYSHEASFRTK